MFRVKCTGNILLFTLLLILFFTALSLSTCFHFYLNTEEAKHMILSPHSMARAAYEDAGGMSASSEVPDGSYLSYI